MVQSVLLAIIEKFMPQTPAGQCLRHPPGWKQGADFGVGYEHNEIVSSKVSRQCSGRIPPSCSVPEL